MIPQILNFYKDRKILLLQAVCFILLVNGCTSQDKVYIYRAAERADVDIIAGRVGVIRTLYCDIYIEYVDKESWNRIRRTETFRGSGSGNPADPCFHFVIVNTWNKPFSIDRVEASIDGIPVAAEDYGFIRDPGYPEKRFSVSISSMLKKRRILSDINIPGEIDFDNDTVEYRLDFIAPGDRISFFGFFPGIGTGKKSRIRLGIKYHDMKKVIDFDIGRFEYTETENM